MKGAALGGPFCDSIGHRLVVFQSHCRLGISSDAA